MSYLKKKIFLSVFLQLFLLHSVIVQGATITARSATDHLDQNEKRLNGEVLIAANNKVQTEPKVTRSSGSSGTETAKVEDKSQPQTQSEDTDNTGVWVATGTVLGLAALVGLVSGTGSSSSSDSDSGDSGGGTSGETNTHYFKSPIRIGDDTNYNGEHKDNFKINTPSGISYSESFQLSGTVSKGTLKYTIAGAIESAKIYMNSSLVGRSCNPGNTANAVKECNPIDVTSKLRTGTNTLKISCVLYPGDTVSPYDDIEIYNMRLITTH